MGHQETVAMRFRRFKKIIRSGRPALSGTDAEDALLDPKTGRNLATGEIFTAFTAKSYGLVDEIGFIEDAIERAIELAGLDTNRARVVQFERPPSLVEMAGIPTFIHQDSALATLLELSAPRAFYLATSLPLVATSPRD